MNVSISTAPARSTSIANGGRRHCRTEARRAERSVLVVDDHRLFSELLQDSLNGVAGLECVGVAHSSEEGLRVAAELRPSVIVMDIQMQGNDGLAATRRIRSLYPDTAVVVVTGHSTGEWAARAAAAGASAYVVKGGSFAELIEVLRTATPGPMLCSPTVRGTVPAMADLRGSAPMLTVRELEVLGFIAQGMAAKTIAKVMGISLHTCRGYIKIVYSKLQVSSRIEAVNEARQLQLLLA